MRELVLKLSDLISTGNTFQQEMALYRTEILSQFVF